jgi:hypothetical protein
MRTYFFIFLFSFALTCRCQTRSSFYSIYTVYEKKELFLEHIEKEIQEKIQEAKEKKKMLSFQVYAYYSNWRMDLTLNEIPLNETSERTSSYELYLQWNQSIDIACVIGYSNIYKRVAEKKDHSKETITAPMRNIPLGYYSQFISKEENQKLISLLQSDLTDLLNLRSAGDLLYSKISVDINDSCSRYTSLLLEQLAHLIAGNMYYGQFLCYSFPDLTKPMSNEEKEQLQVSSDTTWMDKKDKMVYAVSKDVHKANEFKVITTWIMTPVETQLEMSRNRLPGLIRLSREISAIGMVINGKTLYLKYSDLKKLCQGNGIDFGQYERIFQTKNIEKISLHLNY